MLIFLEQKIALIFQIEPNIVPNREKTHILEISVFQVQILKVVFEWVNFSSRSCKFLVLWKTLLVLKLIGDYLSKVVQIIITVLVALEIVYELLLHTSSYGVETYHPYWHTTLLIDHVVCSLILILIKNIVLDVANQLRHLICSILKLLVLAGLLHLLQKISLQNKQCCFEQILINSDFRILDNFLNGELQKFKDKIVTFFS